MRTMKPLFIASIAALLSVSAQAQFTARPGAPAWNQPANNLPAQFLPNAVITEGFDTVSPPALSPPCTLAANLTAAGWFARNNAVPPGTSCVFNGGSGTTFPAQSGAATSYAAMNFNSSVGSGNISTFFVTPRVNFGTGARLEFWTRASNAFPDRLEVRISTAADTGTPDVGIGTTDVGTFTNLALTINTGLVIGDTACPAAAFTASGSSIPSGYPTSAWCKITISGAALPSTGSGRIAFRYAVPTGGPTGANSDFVGIDTFSFDEGALGSAIINPGIAPGPINFGNLIIGQGSQRSLVFTNTGTVAGAVTCTTTGAGFAVAPIGAQTIAPNASTTFTITATSSGAGPLAGSLTCTSGGNTFVFALNAFTSPVTNIPTLSTIGSLFLVMMLGGLAVFAIRRNG